MSAGTAVEVKPTPGPLAGPDGLNLTSIGNADRFLRDYATDLRWVEGTSLTGAGQWYFWNSKRWAPSNSHAARFSQQTVRRLGELVKLAAKQDSKLAETCARFWQKSEADYECSEILSLAKRHCLIDRGTFDSNPDLLGVRNGVLDLQTGVCRAAAKEDYLTMTAHVDYDAAATCPTWLNFLHTTTDGDKELERYLQQSIGLTISGHQNEHVFFLIIGKAATGKSTFHETIQYVLGDYAVSINPETLAQQNRAGSQAGRARPDIAKLPGRRFIVANESRAGMKFDEGLVKALTGNDTICARQLYQAEFDFKMVGYIWLRTNAEPLFDGADTGMQRRLKRVPFDHVIPKELWDKQLNRKLRTEAAGILNWALAGLKDYQANGLIEPPIVQRVTAEYIAGLDVIGQFVAERLEVNPRLKCSARAAYGAYEDWMRTDGQQPFGLKRFKSDMVGRGFEHRATKAGQMWFGFGLSERGDRLNEPVSTTRWPASS